jgi:type I restriction enzyme S subunit
MFYSETRFRKTSLGNIPRDWETLNLPDIAEVVSGFGFPLEYQGKTHGKYPFIKVGDLNAVRKYVNSAENFVDDNDLEALKAKAFPPNTIIFPKIGMAIYLNKFRMLKVWGTFDNNVAGIIPRDCDPEFLFYYFVGKVDLKRLSNRTTAPSIRKSTLESLVIPLPPTNEQKGIVEVLSAVDETVLRIDVIIAKTERLRKGLMQRLLTRGIGHKSVAKGGDPAGWKFVELKDIALVKEGIYGKRGNGDVIQLKADSIQDDGRINPNAFAEMSVERDIGDYLLESGDILLSNRNSANRVGKTAMFRGEFPRCVFSNLLTRIRLQSEDIVQEWLLYVFTKMHDDNIFRALGTRAVNQVLLKKGTVANIKIPLPPLAEQQKITEILSTVDKKLELERNRKSKLDGIRSGLMDLLLTGRIRVKVN